MTRRGFLGRALGLLPLPAFIEASKLWLPPERSIICPTSEPDIGILDEHSAPFLVERFSDLSLTFKMFYAQKLQETLNDMHRFLEDPMACIPKNAPLIKRSFCVAPK